MCAIDGWTEEMIAAYGRAKRAQGVMNDQKHRSFMRTAARANVKKIVKSIVRMATDQAIEVDRKYLASMSKPEHWPPTGPGGW